MHFLLFRFRDCYSEALQLWSGFGDHPNERISGTRVTFTRLSEVLGAVRKTSFYANGAVQDERSPKQQQQQHQQRLILSDEIEILQQQQGQHGHGDVGSLLTSQNHMDVDYQVLIALF